MKGIGPRLMTAGAVSPGTIRALSSNDIACRAHGPVTETDFTCQTAYCRQHFTCQQVRIEDSGLIDRRIAETHFVTRLFRSLEIVKDEIADSPRERKILGPVDYFRGFAKRARSKSGRYHRRRSFRRKERTRLPIKVVPPARATESF